VTYSEKAERERIMVRLGEDEDYWRLAAATCGMAEAEGLYCRTPTYLLEKLEEQMTAEVIPHPSMPSIEQAFSLDNLTERDRDALVIHLARHYVGVAAGDSVELEDLMARAGMTPVGLWHSCAGTTVLPLMIAAYALRGVTRLPDDPRLDPKPHDSAPVKAPRSAAEAARRRREPVGSVSMVGRYLASVAPNPKRQGSASAARYALYSVGLSREELRDRGLTQADFKHDTEHGFVSWRDTAHEPVASTDADEEVRNADVI
jgi:hypothetical protein